jgi:hypothetical protein
VFGGSSNTVVSVHHKCLANNSPLFQLDRVDGTAPAHVKSDFDRKPLATRTMNHCLHSATLPDRVLERGDESVSNEVQRVDEVALA